MDAQALVESIVSPVAHLYESNCEHVSTPSSFRFSGTQHSDISMSQRHALLQFMIAATPKSEVVQDIMTRYDDHIANMASSFEHHFVGDGHNQMVELIANVPDTVSPVKAKPVYIQVPDGDKTVLVQSWRVSIFLPGTRQMCHVYFTFSVRSGDGGQLV
jgi:extracellular elastinolytic metalloproteinase